MAVPPDLRDLDLDAVTLKSYIRKDYEFIVTLTGGFGQWVDSRKKTMTDVSLTECTLTFGFDDPDTELLETLCGAISRILDRWLEASMPLRMVAAPGVRTVSSRMRQCICRYLAPSN